MSGMNATLQRLSEAFAGPAGQRDVIALIIYAPFGIVRGELTQASLRAAASFSGDGHVIEVQRASVEHYSNHLPTGNYASLLIDLKGVSGFVIAKEM
jgi:hypothetical protein